MGARDRFQDLVDSWVLSAARPDGTFAELLLGLPGVYPTDALASMTRLCVSAKLPTRQLAAAIEEVSREPYQRPPVPPLPLAHPLDYEWQFTDATAEFLLREVEARAPRGPIALLGTPSLRAAAARLSSGRDVRVFDLNPLKDGQTAGRGVDITTSELPAVAAAAVVADPPWYPSYYRSFLWATTVISRKGALLLLTLPPEGTRPGVRRERAAVVRYCSKLGLRLVALRPQILRYASPHFELNALRAAGLPGVPWDWRSADLGIFKKRNVAVQARPRPPAAPMLESVSIGRVGWRVRMGMRPDLQIPELRALVPGEVLPSVSRRHSVHRLANVWTSGNRAFWTSQPNELVAVLRAVSANADTLGQKMGRPLSEQERDAKQLLVERIRSINAVEESELARYG